jgi:hypothetical protein
MHYRTTGGCVATLKSESFVVDAVHELDSRLLVRGHTVLGIIDVVRRGAADLLLLLVQEGDEDDFHHFQNLVAFWTFGVVMAWPVSNKLVSVYTYYRKNR